MSDSLIYNVNEQPINGNRGTQHKLSVLINASKYFASFQQTWIRVPNLECHVKNDLIGFPETDKKVRLRLLALLGIRLHPKTSDSLRSRNPVCQ